jgi:hypothetical protein
MLGVLIVCGAISGTIAVWFSIRLGLAVNAGEQRIRAAPAVVSLIVTWGIALFAFAESLAWTL